VRSSRALARACRRLVAFAVSAALATGVAACGGLGAGGDDGDEKLSGTISVDGSSTVGPLSEAAAALFREEHPDVRVNVGTSGTGGGFEKFCRGETDITNASRRIDEDEEETCGGQGIAYEEVTVANDALSVVVNPANDWIQCASVDELRAMWDRGSDLGNWSQVRDGFPDEELRLFGPGTDSGTFDYFTEAITGEQDRIRTDFVNIGEDDSAAIAGVGGSRGGLGYIGFSYLDGNHGRVKGIAIRNPDTGECVAPSVDTVQDGSYGPLARQLYLYPSDLALQRPEVRAFVEFYVENSTAIAERADFIALTDEQKRRSQRTLERLAEGRGGPS
jgi:phosphate transport system substrate-binding protein